MGMSWDLGTGRTFMEPSKWWFGGIGASTTIVVFWVFCMLNWIDKGVDRWMWDTIREVGETRWDVAEVAYYYFLN